MSDNHYPFGLFLPHFFIYIDIPVGYFRAFLELETCVCYDLFPRLRDTLLSYTVNWATLLWCLRLFSAPADCLQFCQGFRKHKRRFFFFLDFGLYYSMDWNTCLKGNETLEV